MIAYINQYSQIIAEKSKIKQIKNKPLESKFKRLGFGGTSASQFELLTFSGVIELSMVL